MSKDPNRAAARLGTWLIERGMKLLGLRENARAAVFAVLHAEERGDEDVVDELAVGIIRTWGDR